MAYLAVRDTEPADASHKLLLPDRNDIRKEEKDRAFISSFMLRKDLHSILKNLLPSPRDVCNSHFRHIWIGCEAFQALLQVLGLTEVSRNF